jgi:hypothetical protein
MGNNDKATKRRKHLKPMYDALDEMLRERGEKVPVPIPEKPPKTLGQKIRNGTITVVGVAILIESIGVGIGVAVNPELRPVSGQEITQEATQWPYTIIYRIENGQPIPDNYDYTATKGILGENNMEYWTPEQYAQNVPKFSAEDEYRYFPLSIKFKDGITHPLTYKYDEWGRLVIGNIRAGDELCAPFTGDIDFTGVRRYELSIFSLVLYGSEGKPRWDYTIELKKKYELGKVISGDKSETYISPFAIPEQYYTKDYVNISIAAGQVIGLFNQDGELKVSVDFGDFKPAIAPSPGGKAIILN